MSVIVAYLGLDKSAYFELYYIDFVYGWKDLFFFSGYYDLDKMFGFENLIKWFDQLLDAGYYYLCVYISLKFFYPL